MEVLPESSLNKLCDSKYSKSNAYALEDLTLRAGNPVKEAQQHISNESPLLVVNTPRCDEDSIKLKALMVLCSKLSNMVLALELSKTAQDLVIKKLQKKVKRIKRKIKARTPGITLFKIGNFRRKSLDKENVSKQGRYIKTSPVFEESNFDNIDDMVDNDRTK
nr:hypothetical protein [Tanacetum cinerariifolium]